MIKPAEYAALRDGYFDLRQQSEGLKTAGVRFEAMPWRLKGSSIFRESDEWKLSVYCVEGQIEACVTEPNGQSSTYS